MNFYIGNFIDEVNIQDSNVEFNDELIDYIYKLNSQVSFDMSKLCEINPYDDIIISVNDLSEIIKICNYILDEFLLQNYKEQDEGNQMLEALIELAKEAISRNMGLVSIGD